MNKFEKKMEDLKNEIALLEWQYGENQKANRLKKHLAVYESVSKMSIEEALEKLNQVKVEISNKSFIAAYEERFVCKVLKEKLRAEKKEKEVCANITI